MKLLRQLCIVLTICFLGEFISKSFKLPIPGSVLGMIILFICLYTNFIQVDMLEEISAFLLDHLAFFFIPASVGLISCLSILKTNGLIILIISIISTVAVTVVTGFTVQFLKRRLLK